MSSTLFYPEDYSNTLTPKKEPKANISYTKNQLLKKELHEKRMQKLDKLTNKIHQ